jgi:ferritin-like metal-binding protein YciE
MFERVNTPTDALKRELEGAFTMECEIIDMLDELIENSQDESVKHAFREHLRETQGHARGLETVFELFRWDVDGSPCPTITAIEKEGKANVKKADDGVVDAVILAGAIETEHHEIAVYENLIIRALALGRDDAAAIFERNREEEHGALEKVKQLAREQARAGATQSA